MSYKIGDVYCNCGTRAVIRTSWSNENPGRRFNSCLHYNRGGCGFFAWEDPLMCGRSKSLIPGLLRRINAMEQENTRMKNEMNTMVEEIKKLKLMNRKLLKLLVLFL